MMFLFMFNGPKVQKPSYKISKFNFSNWEFDISSQLFKIYFDGNLFPLILLDSYVTCVEDLFQILNLHCMSCLLTLLNTQWNKELEPPSFVSILSSIACCTCRVPIYSCILVSHFLKLHITCTPISLELYYQDNIFNCMNIIYMSQIRIKFIASI